MDLMEIDLSKNFEGWPELALKGTLKVIMLIEAELFALYKLEDGITHDIDLEINDEQLSRQGLTKKDVENIFFWIWKELPLIDYKIVPKRQNKEGCIKIHIVADNVGYFREFADAVKKAAMGTKKDGQKYIESERQNNPKSKKNKYWLSYTKGRELILNDEFFINKMQFESVSDCWFDYLFKNPNKPITLTEIREKTKKAGTSFNKFLDNVKFKGQLRKLFFKQGKRGGIELHNPITEEDFKNKIINEDLLIKQIKKFRNIK